MTSLVARPRDVAGYRHAHCVAQGSCSCFCVLLGPRVYGSGAVRARAQQAPCLSRESKGSTGCLRMCWCRESKGSTGFLRMCWCRESKGSTGCLRMCWCRESKGSTGCLHMCWCRAWSTRSNHPLRAQRAILSSWTTSSSSSREVAHMKTTQALGRRYACAGVGPMTPPGSYEAHVQRSARVALGLAVPPGCCKSHDRALGIVASASRVCANFQPPTPNPQHRPLYCPTRHQVDVRRPGSLRQGCSPSFTPCARSR